MSARALVAALVALLGMSLAGEPARARDGDAADSAAASPCPGPASEPCRVATPHGTYLVAPHGAPGSRQARAALLVDLGGPGVAPGALERATLDGLPRALSDDRLVIVLGARWGVAAPTKRCLDALARHVEHARGRERDDTAAERAARICALRDAVARHARASAALVETILADWDVTRYEVVGASYAASRWSALLPALAPAQRPERLTVVSPLAPGTSLRTLAEWQGGAVERTWRAVCGALAGPAATRDCTDAVAELAANGQIAALMMLAWSPAAAAELAGYVESHREELADTVGVFSDRYFFLNAVDYPKDELFEYLVGVCAGIVVDARAPPPPLTASPLARRVVATVTRFHSICHGLGTAPRKGGHEVPVCYVELADERVTPPVSWSATGVEGGFRNVVIGPGIAYPHGAFAALREVTPLARCARAAHGPRPQVDELAPGLLTRAASLIGSDRLFVPAPFPDYAGSYDLGEILVARRRDEDGTVETRFVSLPDFGAGEIIGYCLIGWLVPDNGDAGTSHVTAVGLDGNAAPGCDRREEIERFETEVGDLTIVERIACARGASCRERLREALAYLGNGEIFVRLR